MLGGSFASGDVLLTSLSPSKSQFLVVLFVKENSTAYTENTKDTLTQAVAMANMKLQLELGTVHGVVSYGPASRS